MSDDIQKQDEPQAAPGTPASGVPAVTGTAGTSPAPVTGDQPAAGPLSPADLQRVADISSQVDVGDAQEVLQYGLPAQNRSPASPTRCSRDVRTKDTGYVGDILSDLVKKVKELDVDSLSGGTPA